MAAHRRHVLFCKIQVRLQACRSYPLWHPWVISNDQLQWKILICLTNSLHFQDPSKTSHFFTVGVFDALNADQNWRSRLIIIISIPRLTKKSTVANMFPKLDPENLTGIPLGSKLPLMRQSHPCMSMNRSGNWFKDRTFEIELGPFPLTCNPSKWGADIWGWVEVRRSAMLHYTVNQCLHTVGWHKDIAKI